MARKEIVSVTLDNAQITRLNKYAKQRHEGNRSKALRALIMASVNLDLQDYEHPYPPSARNWMGTGKCNPKNASVGACPICWGHGAKVSLQRDHKGIQRVIIENEVEDHENQ